MENYQQTKDFEEFLLIESIIETEFLNWIKEDLLEELKNTYKNWSNFSKSWELMNVLLKWREVLKKWWK